MIYTYYMTSLDDAPETLEYRYDVDFYMKSKKRRSEAWNWINENLTPESFKFDEDTEDAIKIQSNNEEDINLLRLTYQGHFSIIDFKEKVLYITFILPDLSGG